ncbi:MAG: 50S ribosomal protein L32 [bacterium]|nr:50S ribosomal protein L32 [bacterium]
MTPLPKRKHSTMRKGKRRASISLSLPNLMSCPNCSKPKLSHVVCPHCGYYKGRPVLTVKTKKDKKKES